MPYIKAARRVQLCLKGVPKEAGELNYLLSIILADWIDSQGLSYESLSTAIGALECAKLELYRRHAWYEDKKREENGDVYYTDEKLELPE